MLYVVLTAFCQVNFPTGTISVVLYCTVFCCCSLLVFLVFFFFYKICLLASRGRKMQKHNTQACFFSEKYLAFTRAAQLWAAGIQRPIKGPCRQRLENVLHVNSSAPAHSAFPVPSTRIHALQKQEALVVSNKLLFTHQWRTRILLTTFRIIWFHHGNAFINPLVRHTVHTCTDTHCRFVEVVANLFHAQDVLLTLYSL